MFTLKGLRLKIINILNTNSEKNAKIMYFEHFYILILNIISYLNTKFYNLNTIKLFKTNNYTLCRALVYEDNVP